MAFDKKISSELHAYGAEIFKTQALPNNTNLSSSAFCDAGILAGNEIVITADTAISLTAAKTLTIELTGADTETGNYSVLAKLADFTGAKSFASGDELARFVPNSKANRFLKLKVTDTEDLSAAKISAVLVHKG